MQDGARHRRAPSNRRVAKATLRVMPGLISRSCPCPGCRCPCPCWCSCPGCRCFPCHFSASCSGGTGNCLHHKRSRVPELKDRACYSPHVGPCTGLRPSPARHCARGNRAPAAEIACPIVRQWSCYWFHADGRRRTKKEIVARANEKTFCMEASARSARSSSTSTRRCARMAGETLRGNYRSLSVYLEHLSDIVARPREHAVAAA